MPPKKVVPVPAKGRAPSVGKKPVAKKQPAPAEAAASGASPSISPAEARLAQLHEKHDGAFNKYAATSAGLTKGNLAQLIRDSNDDFTWLDDSSFPGFMKQAWADTKPNDEGIIKFEAFAEWYESFLVHVEGVRVQEAQKAAAKKAAEAAMFEGDGMWTVPMTKLLDAQKAASAKGRAPLLIDATSDDGQPSSPLESYFLYSGHNLLEMKKMVVQVSFKKEKTVEEVMEEARKKLVMSMKRGYHLIMLLSNSAPPFRSKFSSPTQLPYALLDDFPAVLAVRGEEVDWKEAEWARTLLRREDDIVFVHKDFNVVVVTGFSEGDYAGHLGNEFPLDKMQHIKVVRDS